MDEYFRVIENLPESLCGELQRMNPSIAPFIQEIRLRLGQPVYFTSKGRLVPAGKFIPSVKECRIVTAELLKDCFLSLCRYSAYAYEKELRQGYLTTSDGSRVGIAGEWGTQGFRSVSSLNLRIARQIRINLPSEMKILLAAEPRGILVIGPPGSGKTTVLRSIVYELAQSGRIICVMDERSELFGENAAEQVCDIFSRIPKAEAIEMALRCMNPQIIVCDEIGTEHDAAAIQKGIASGAAFVASVHCTDMEELKSKRWLKGLLDSGAFQTVAELDGRENPGTIRAVLPMQ